MTKPIKQSLFVLFFFALLSLILLSQYQRSENKSIIMSHQVSVPMLVIHPPETKKMAAKIHKLTDSYLFLLLKKKNQIFFFTHVEQLKPYDSDDDNVIDNGDAIFEHLYVGAYDKKKQTLVYHPIAKTAIRAIRLDLKQQGLSRAEVVFSDNHLRHRTNPLDITAEYFIQDELRSLKTRPKI